MDAIFGNQNFTCGPGNYSKGNPERSVPASDIGSEAWSQKTDLLQSGIFVQATIKTHNAGFGSYVINAPGFLDRWAVCVPATLAIFGAREYAAIQAGQAVLVWFAHAEAECGLIIGPIPWTDGQGYRTLGGLLTEGAGVGAGYDAVHRRPMALDNKSDAEVSIPDFNDGRPWDVLGGDYTVLNELGVGLAILKLNASLCGGGSSGFTASYLDNAAWVYGDRLVRETPVMEENLFIDQGEGSTIRRSTPYLWEGLGAAKAGDAIHTAGEPRLDPSDTGDLVNYGPLQWDQEGIFRRLELEGYLGGISHSWVAWPRAAETPNRRSATLNWPGLCEVHTDVDGFLIWRTAKGVLIEKTCKIPVPQLKKDPWDPTGDKDAACNWKKDPYPEDQAEYDWGDEDPTSRAARLLDHNAHRTGTVSKLPLRDHPLDWRVPTDAESDVTGTGSEALPPHPITPLGDVYRDELPKAVEVDLDGRRQKTVYRTGRAFWYMGDDGSIVQQDASGSSIVSAGGNIEIAPRGDLVLRPARRLVVMAPKDVVINAGRNIELAASKGAIRAKAEYDVHVVAGNSGTTGGLLLESRADDASGTKNSFAAPGVGTVSTGILFKSAKAPILAWGSAVHVQSTSGGISIDAQNGLADLLLTGKDVRVAGAQKVTLLAGASSGETSGNPELASVLSLEAETMNLLAGGTYLGFLGGEVNLVGRTPNSANLFVDGNINASQAFAAASKEIQQTPRSTWRPSPEARRDAVDAVRKREGKALTETRNRVFVPQTGWGNSVFSGKVQFSFHTSEQYGTGEGSLFVWHATYWQSAFEASGHSVAWEQPTVEFQGLETRPFPGHDTWVQTGYGRVTLGAMANYDAAADSTRQQDDGRQYTGIAPEELPLEGHYIVDSQV